MKKPSSKSERLQRLQDRRRELMNQISQEEGRLRRKEKAERNRVLIQLGAIVEEAGLALANPTHLLGALLEIAAVIDQPSQIRHWSDLVDRHTRTHSGTSVSAPDSDGVKTEEATEESEPLQDLDQDYVSGDQFEIDAEQGESEPGDPDDPSHELVGADDKKGSVRSFFTGRT